jgi:nicotinamidase/pyrazinamidase
MNALIIVDVQNDFCPEGALAVNNGDAVVDVINQLAVEFNVVVASKDWHPPETAHFTKWPAHCVRDTDGAAFHPRLDTSKIPKIFFKGTGDKDDGYSAFEATNEDLARYLWEKGVTDVYVAGLAMDYCVRATALDAQKQGFKTAVIRDACRAVESNPGDTQKVLHELAHSGISFVLSKNILHSTNP